ncbi:DHH family phosphoesterase [Candidatus Pacearchaeota archaeon]|nr:DHH family phosphoesterase [Candidatus Pacearchaeota archaeon]
MLTKKQVKEIKGHLDKAQNPLFFFDNDQDGLCSFLLLQRYLGRGKGVPIKTFPKLDVDYFRKIEELNPDYVFILDKPEVSDEFFKEVEQINLPVVWIDHHDVQVKIPKFVDYYNPNFNRKKTNEPVTALCYQVTARKEDLWIAVAGCISDKFVPEFYSEFQKNYPDLSLDSKFKIEYGTTSSAFDIFYKSQIGKVAKLLGFGLKDTFTNVVRMIKFLIIAETPYEVLEEGKKNYLMHKKFSEINKRYNKLLNKAFENEEESGKLLFFKYGGESSMSGSLSNELSYLFPEKFVVIAYVLGEKVNISARGKNIKTALLKVIGELDSASGGGHNDAVGARIKVEDLEKFRERLEGLLG